MAISRRLRYELLLVVPVVGNMALGLASGVVPESRWLWSVPPSQRL